MTKKIINATVIILTILLLIPCICWVYFNTFGKDKVPSSYSSTNVTTITDPQTNEVKQFLEANYYANENGKGKEVVELRLNTYSGPEKQAIYSQGIQMVIDGGNRALYYYNTHLDNSFISCEKFEWGTPMYTNIDGELYALKFDGTRTYRVFNAGKALWFGISGLFTGYGDAYKRTTSEFTEPYTYEDVMNYIKVMVKSSSYGTGDSLIPMLNLNTYFNIYDVDENGKISGEPVGGNGKNEFTASYFSVQCHYDRRGMIFAEQSMFNSVEGNSDFNISGIDFNVDYWQARSEYVVSEKDFEVRESENGTYLYLSNETKNKINLFNDIDLKININIDNLSFKVKGFDFLALSGIKKDIKEFKISSSKKTDFEIKYNAFYETNFDVDNIKTNNVELTIEEVLK